MEIAQNAVTRKKQALVMMTLLHVQTEGAAHTTKIINFKLTALPANASSASRVEDGFKSVITDQSRQGRIRSVDTYELAEHAQRTAKQSK